MQLPINVMGSEEANEPIKLIMKPCTGQRTQRFTANVKQTPQKARHATPSGGWFGLSAEEGRGQPRKGPG